MASWRAIWVVMVVALIPVALAGLAAVSSPGRPADDERATARYFVHKADFGQLVVMLHSQGERLRGARDPVSLADLVAVGADGAAYRVLLAKVGATDLEYFPQSGRIIVPICASESYLYTGDEHSRLSMPTQRYAVRGTGFAPISRDVHIEGGWFVHKEGGAGIMFPY